MADLNKWLVKAAAEGKVDEIAALLDQDADIDFAGRYCTPLMEAIKSENEAAALYLIDCEANLRLRDKYGETALHGACRSGLEAVVRELLKRGADVEAADVDGDRPLHLAALYGHENIVRLLVTEHGAQINAGDEMPPLLLALQQGHEGVASFLLDTKAGWRAAAYDKRTALHCASYGGLTSIAIRLLDEFGLDLHAKTKQGTSCLHFVAFRDHAETCKFLLDRGIPVDEFDEDGRSPLINACALGHASVAELLLDHGADIEHKDDGGRTPLCQAIVACSNREQVALLLIQHGARLDGSLPEDFPFASFDEGLAQALEDGFLKMLFTEPNTPIPPYRRALRWALTSPAVAVVVQKNGWSLLGTCKTEIEVEEMIKKRLGLVEDDAWKRRMHLVIDRALDWGYGESGKAPALEKAKPADEDED